MLNCLSKRPSFETQIPVLVPIVPNVSGSSMAIEAMPPIQKLTQFLGSVDDHLIFGF